MCGCEAGCAGLEIGDSKLIQCRRPHLIGVKAALIAEYDAAQAAESSSGAGEAAPNAAAESEAEAEAPAKDEL